MAVTAINTVRAEMLLRGWDAAALATRLSDAGQATTGPEIAAMIRRRRMPAITFLRIMAAFGSTLMRMPEDISELH